MINVLLFCFLFANRFDRSMKDHNILVLELVIWPYRSEEVIVEIFDIFLISLSQNYICSHSLYATKNIFSILSYPLD